MAHFLTPTLSRESLRVILKNSEVIPEEYRLKLWMGIILQLPNNKSQYISLRKKGKSIIIQMDTAREKCETKIKTISRVAQCLAAHCPSLNNFRHFNLVGFIEPFSSLLHHHELIYFEVMLTLLGKHCI